MKIYADPITVNCRKVLAGLDLIGAPFELEHVDYFKGEQKSPAYLAINPNASIPAMVDDDLVLWESNAILQYAADKAGNHSAYPTNLKIRADINRWLLWESSSWFPSTYVYLVENCVKPLLGGAAHPAVLEAQQAAIDNNPRQPFYNLNIDAGALWARRLIDRQIADERIALALRRLRARADLAAADRAGYREVGRS